jgi:glutaredoxin 2
LSSELGKEIRLRESLESQQTTFSAALAEKEMEIQRLQQQIQSVDKLVVKNETLEGEIKVKTHIGLLSL